ncbi:MAG TPA: hypothetical protein VF079_03530 [Sphingomicrobium sp.]
MTKAPDLSNPEELRAYRRELMAYQRPARLIGLMIVIGGLAMAFWPRISGRWVMVGSISLQQIGWILILVGWVVLIAVIVSRSRYHRRRMKGTG